MAQEPDPVSPRLDQFNRVAGYRVAGRDAFGGCKGLRAVFDRQQKRAIREGNRNPDGMAGLIVIAVQDHVRQRLLHAQVKGEPCLLANTESVGHGVHPGPNPAQIGQAAVQFKPVL